MKSKLELHCPKCNYVLTHSAQRAMSSFWVGVKPVVCGGCRTSIQWHSSIRKRLIIGAHIFKFGIFSVLISFLPIFNDMKQYSNYCFGVGAVLISISIFCTRTPINKIKVELINET